MDKRAFRLAAVVAAVVIVLGLVAPAATQAAGFERESRTRGVEAAAGTSAGLEVWLSLRELWGQVVSMLAPEIAEEVPEGEPTDPENVDDPGEPEPETDAGPGTDPDG